MSGYIGNIPVPQATQTRQSFTANASQTTFNTAGYTAGFIDVFLNGIKLVDGTDYTATNGSDVVLTTGAAVSDVLDVVMYAPFDVVNTSLTDATINNTLTLKNATEEDTDGGRESTIIFKGEQSGGEITTLAQIQASHDGTADDEKGDLIFSTNDGADGNTPTERVRIDADGNVGIGTNDPTSLLSVESANSGAVAEFVSTDAGSALGPLLKVQRSSSSPAVNDQIGQIQFIGKNSADEDITYTALVNQIKNKTDGNEQGRFALNTYTNGVLQSRLNILNDESVFNEDSLDVDFRVESNNKANALFVRGSDGAVILGGNSTITSSPTLAINAPSTNTSFILSRPTTTGTATLVNFYSNVGGSETLQHHFEANGDLEIQGTLTQSSDQRIKQDIVDSGSQWDDIKAVQVRKYRKIWDVEQYGDDADVLLGVVAQELEASGMGGLVKTRINEEDPDDDLKSVKYSVLYMKAIKALQEAMDRIETLETKVAALENPA